MKKRLLAILLGMAMMLTLMPSMAFANGERQLNTKIFTEERIGDFYFWIDDDDTAVLSYPNDSVENATVLVIPASVKFSDGVTRTVTTIEEYAIWDFAKCKTVIVPATVKKVGEYSLGYYYANGYFATKISGFTIFGKTGSAAHKYAIENGFIFRDPEVEKEWNGTYSGAVPAAKGVKAKAAKKSVKVSWKKANKKALKKFDKVEVQVCPDKGFQMTNTKRVVVKKSKKSATVKGLVKGKTYYVRVRNFKGSGTGKLVSKWSKVKKVKIKK